VDSIDSGAVDIRRADAADADHIAMAHVDSIRSIGPRFYPLATVNAWAAGLTAALYVRAMEAGEAFYIAVGAIDGRPAVLGFATHRVDDHEHGTSVYVRGRAARRGLGSALYRRAEADAVAAGASSLQVDASLAAVEFYRANGFEAVGRGTHLLSSGAPMACVYMRKVLPATRQSATVSNTP
jgi:putative acetyltransferase